MDGDIHRSGEIRVQRLERESRRFDAVCVDGSEEDIMWFDIAVHDGGDLVQPVQAGD